MNYVAFAGILSIDNLFMENQKPYHSKLGDLIDNSNGNSILELFKS